MRNLLFILLNIIIIPVSLIINLLLLPFRLFLPNKFRKRHRSAGLEVDVAPPPSQDGEDLVEIAQLEGGKGRMAKVNFDALSQDQQEQLIQSTIDDSELDIFDGEVKHGYDTKFISRTDRCPRCHSPVEQKYGNFIYATDVAPRIMFAPAGYFCQKCPTVIIDQDFIIKGIVGKFKYFEVLGIDNQRDGEHPELFDTWNGKKAVYVIDEDGNPEGIVAMDKPPHAPQSCRRDRQKAHRKKKLEKQSRKKNRRKK